MTNLTHTLDALLAAHVAQGRGLIMGAWETKEGECPLNILGRHVRSEGSQWLEVPARHLWLAGFIIGWDESAEQSREQIARNLYGEMIEGAMVGEAMARKYHWSVEYKGIRSFCADESTALLYDGALHPGLKLSEREQWEKYARTVNRWAGRVLDSEKRERISASLAKLSQGKMGGDK